MPWPQVYNPLHNHVLSTAVAALPVCVLLGSLAIWQLRAHFAALLGLAVALAIALGVYRMPAIAAVSAALNGAAYGFFPIGWIVINLLFLYQLTVEKGWFTVLRDSFTRVTPDPRIQVILIAFSFGAFFEGAAGFGTPVAVTAAILIQLGFRPLSAAGLSLIANTAPVAFGGIGIPVIALSTVTGIDVHTLSAMIGRQLPLFSFIVPFWVVWALAGWRGMLGVWPAALTAGGSFAIVQALVSNFYGPWLVDISASLVSLGSVLLLLRFWRPKSIWSQPGEVSEGERGWKPRLREASGKPRLREVAKTGGEEAAETHRQDAAKMGGQSVDVPSGRVNAGEVLRAWVPWMVLSLLVFLWGLPQMKRALDHAGTFTFRIASLDGRVARMPPVVPHPSAEKAMFVLNALSATGSGILAAAILSGLFMRFGPRKQLEVYGRTLWRNRHALITIASMLALGTLTRYGGIDATLGLALAGTGALYPFFGTLLGWLGTALTGSDTASNVLFGSLQTITARQIGVSPVLMSAANSSGGVMGKMIDAQSIVVASTVTGWYGHEGRILRFVFLHSVALAVLIGILVELEAKVAPFTRLVVR